MFDPLEMVDLMMFPAVEPLEMSRFRMSSLVNGLEMGNLTDLTGKYWRYCNNL